MKPIRFITLLLYIGFQLLGLQGVLHATNIPLEVNSENATIPVSFQEKQQDIKAIKHQGLLDLIAEIVEENLEEETQNESSQTKLTLFTDISSDGTEFYFGVDNNGVMEIHFSNLIDGVWSPQKKLFESDAISYNDPMFSPDQKRLYFISNLSLDGERTKKDIDIWYIERESKISEWSKPINLDLPVNSQSNEYYASFTIDGTLYFASKDKSRDAPSYAYDIYSSKYKDGKFQKPEILPKSINTDRYEADVFVSLDESYMIFCSIRRNGLGKGDLYISFKDKEGNWSDAVNMGESINTENHELCPFVSADGKYLFYTSNQDIYWVSTKILDNYKE